MLVGLSATIAGVLGGQIWHEGGRLPQFKLEIATWLCFMLLLVFAPLCFFVAQLMRSKDAGLREYGLVASRYVTEFRRKWIEGGAANDEALMGTADIQSLADLGNSSEVVHKMRVLPFGTSIILRLTMLLLLPFAPLSLTMVPLEQLLDRAIGLFF